MLIFILLAFWATSSYGEAIGVHALRSSSTPLIKSSTIATRSSSAVPSTITTGPITTSPVPINTCSYYNETESRTLWDDPWCSMYAGMVDLVYWPTDNKSYPSTFYDHKHNHTYSSPSVYMVVSTLYGWNPCGLLGPSTSREVFAFDLTEVSTLVPYTDLTETTRRATRQLYLSDLGVGCATEYNKTELATQTHPMKADDTRCNPFLVVPAAIKQYGYPYWLHCGVAHNKFGLFDPPYAIPPTDELIPTTTTATTDASETENTTAATSASTKATAPINPEATEPATTKADATAIADPVNTSSSHASSSDSSPETTNTATVDPESTSTNNASNFAGGDAIIANPANTDTAVAITGDSQTSTGAAVGDGNSQPTATTNALYTTVTGAEDQFDPTDYTSGVVSTTSTQVVSLGTGGLEVINPDTGITMTSAYGNTVPATTAVYNGQTLTLGGPAATVTNVAVMVSPGLASPTGTADAVGSGANNGVAVSTISTQVVSLGAGGLVIVNPDTGVKITSAYVNMVPTTAVYNGKTLSLGGLAVTVTNVVGVSPDTASQIGAVDSTTSNQVVRLGAGGLVIVNPDTGVTITSAYSNTVPTTAVYSGQTLTLGGSAVTVTNIVGVSPDAASQTGAADATGSTTSNQVVSLGAGGLVIVNLDTGITITSVYGTTVPTTAVYSGQTLTFGGPIVKIVNAAAISSSSANATSATTATTASGSNHINASSVSSGISDTTGVTQATSSGNTPIAISTTVRNSSANKLSGGFAGLFLALMASIWL
ncbi:hypothetical protein PITC_072670 [Penicillium italicum]|uniref:Uncharacterized protein n=1 Tax=Penicillium italicum TaxID=40296 RepID=A0A0A2L5F4_PENIT|nr:hypothetical protein PITC_072670 [Penicillium italicum]